MKGIDGRLTDEAELLNQYLSQYRHCIGKKRVLENRRKEILREFDNPLGPLKLDGMPRGSNAGMGCAAVSFRLDEIDTRIKEQINISAKILTDIMNVIDFLPENSIERSIIENRYIDRYGWERVCRENFISRTSAIRIWKRGIYRLLGFKKVKNVLEEYKTLKSSNAEDRGNL